MFDRKDIHDLINTREDRRGTQKSTLSRQGYLVNHSLRPNSDQREVSSDQRRQCNTETWKAIRQYAEGGIWGGCDAQHRSDGTRSSILGAQCVLINDAVEGQDQSGPGEVSDESSIQTMTVSAEPHPMSCATHRLRVTMIRPVVNNATSVQPELSRAHPTVI